MIIQSAYIEITNYCNLDCITCYNRSGNNLSHQEISYQQLAIIIDQLVKHGCKGISIGGGEPCLHSEFDAILDLPEQHPEVEFGIVSNGTIYSEKLIKTFKSDPKFSVQISLDGSCEEKNAKTRGCRNFAKSVKFLKSLQIEKKKPNIKMVISQNNLDDVASFYRFVLSMNGTPDYAFINRRGNGQDNWGDKCVTAKQKLKTIRLIEKLNNEYNIKAALPFCTSDCPLSERDTPMSIAIKTDGSIMPCQLLYDAKFTLGNVFNFDINEIENGFDRIVQMVKQRKSTDYGCSICLLRNHCHKGCMALADDMTENPLECDGDCEYRKLQIVGYDIRKTINGDN